MVPDTKPDPTGGTAAPAPIPCSNCRRPMQFRDLERNDRGTLRVDLCFDCAGIWFDDMESVRLAPSAVIELFREIHDHQTQPAQPVVRQMSCPRCEGSLEPGFDLCKSGRFSYFRCVRGHGRFTPFMQFLREKQFVRDLTQAELQQVRERVKQVQCSECGAPIDLEHETQCRYCHAPVSFLDPTAVQKAVAMWSQAQAHQQAVPTPETVANALLAVRHDTAQRQAVLGAHFFQPTNFSSLDAQLLGSGLDLVAGGIHALGRLFAGHD